MMPNKTDDIIRQLSSIEDESNLIKNTIDLIKELVEENKSLKRQTIDMAVDLSTSYFKGRR